MLLDGQGLVWAEDSPEGRGLPHAGRAEVPFYVIVWVRATGRRRTGVKEWRLGVPQIFGPWRPCQTLKQTIDNNASPCHAGSPFILLVFILLVFQPTEFP